MFVGASDVNFLPGFASVDSHRQRLFHLRFHRRLHRGLGRRLSVSSDSSSGRTSHISPVIMDDASNDDSTTALSSPSRARRNRRDHEDAASYAPGSPSSISAITDEFDHSTISISPSPRPRKRRQLSSVLEKDSAASPRDFLLRDGLGNPDVRGGRHSRG